MHVCLLTSEYGDDQTPVGGLGTYVRVLEQELARRGHHVSVVLLGGRRAPADGAGPVPVARFRFPRWLHRRRVVWVALPAAEMVINARRIARAVHGLHRRQPVDVVQSANYEALGLRLVGSARVPLVCRLSSFAPMLRAAAGRVHDLGQHLTEWLESRLALQATGLFAPSGFLAAAFERYEGRTPDVVRTPILRRDEVERIGRRAEAAPFPYLLFIGKQSRVKGADLLFRALPELLATHPSLRVVLAGPPSPDAWDPEARRHADEAARHPRVVQRGALPRAELLPLVARALAVVLPSRVDNYPNAALEAVAFGVPVVGSTGSSLEEMVRDGETGMLFPNGSVAGLAAAMETLVSMPGARLATMRKAVLAHAESLRDADPVGQTVAVYERACEGFRQRAG